MCRVEGAVVKEAITDRSSRGVSILCVRRRQGVVHYYPYDGERETRPQMRAGEEDDDSATIQAFWEGRLVPESSAAALSFFPLQKL